MRLDTLSLALWTRAMFLCLAVPAPRAVVGHVSPVAMLVEGVFHVPSADHVWLSAPLPHGAPAS